MRRLSDGDAAGWTASWSRTERDGALSSVPPAMADAGEAEPPAGGRRRRPGAREPGRVDALHPVDRLRVLGGDLEVVLAAEHAADQQRREGGALADDRPGQDVV